MAHQEQSPADILASGPASRRYWFTLHWPPSVGDSPYGGVFLAEGTQQVGKNLSSGDFVWIFESRTGRPTVQVRADGTKVTTQYEWGRRGVIALCEVTAPLQTRDVPPELYADGTKKWWCWEAPTRFVRTSGFIPHQETCRILGYKPNYGFRGFGTAHSGLKEISEATHQALFRAYDQKSPALPEEGPPPRAGGPPGGEGPVHRALKEKVFADPAGVLAEPGLEPVKMEFAFQTGDRADVILRDAEGKFVAVEVEVEVHENDLSGVLQAIKYGRMYALVARRPYHEGRSVLVAHVISQEVKALCEKYDVEWFEVER